MLLCTGRVPSAPTPGRVTPASPCALPTPRGGALCTSDETAPLGVGWGHTWDRTLGRGSGKGSGWTSASSRLGLEAPGRPLPARLLPPPPWEEARLPQNADLDEMVFYGDLLKRGEIPVKDLQLSKHRVGPAAAARAQSPESASPERVPPPRLCAPTASP